MESAARPYRAMRKTCDGGSEMINQILMAAARGARIQFTGNATWDDTDCIVLGIDPRIVEYRIHPDDEHLRFGPISGALREAAMNPPHSLDEALFAASGKLVVRVEGKLNDYLSYGPAPEFHRSLFLLILSEALSEEGL